MSMEEDLCVHRGWPLCQQKNILESTVDSLYVYRKRSLCQYYMTFMSMEEGRPLTEEDLWWKKTFDGRRPLTEFAERKVGKKFSYEKEFTFDGRGPSTVEDLWWKKTFDGVCGEKSWKKISPTK